MQNLIGTKEACRLLDIDKATLYRWISEERLAPAMKLPQKNGPYLFDRADIESLARARADA
jgi:excisionase family DNA binding protein